MCGITTVWKLALIELYLWSLGNCGSIRNRVGKNDVESFHFDISWPEWKTGWWVRTDDFPNGKSNALSTFDIHAVLFSCVKIYIFRVLIYDCEIFQFWCRTFNISGESIYRSNRWIVGNWIQVSKNRWVIECIYLWPLVSLVQDGIG